MRLLPAGLVTRVTLAPARRRLLGPVGATAAIAVLTVAGLAAGVAAHPGWPLTWLLLGLTAGYALSGSA